MSQCPWPPLFHDDWPELVILLGSMAFDFEITEIQRRQHKKQCSILNGPVAHKQKYARNVDENDNRTRRHIRSTSRIVSDYLQFGVQW